MEHIKKHIVTTIKSKQYWATFCSTFAIAMLVIFFFSHNPEVNASVAPVEDINELAAAVEEENEYAEIDAADDAAVLAALNEVEALPNEEVREQIVELKSGDTFLNILTNLGLEYNEANDIYLAVKKVYDPRNLRAGQKLQLTTIWNPAENKLVSINQIVSAVKVGEKFIVERNEDGAYSAQLQKDELIEEINSASGTIEGNLSVSMNSQKVPSRIVANFISIFSYSIDFRRDVKRGDKFEIIYENYITPDGQVVQNGNILYASLTLGKNKIDLYRFKDASGNVDYYDAKGLALKKTLSRKPMSYQNARISSPFGKRRHPIYRDVRIHWGVDYAAPRNSLVYAAGDGVVLSAKYNGGYGNYIKIRHNSEYSTAYGHMQKFAKGIRPGVRVKQGQVIGYVGSTGRSTGPHLHYEVVKNGKRVNPLTIKASASENLRGRNLSNFKHIVAKIQNTHQKMFAKANPEKKPEKLAQNETAPAETQQN